jgi:enamine deaminase RidA (YjgF/YER057c/UK114 family)
MGFGELLGRPTPSGDYLSVTQHGPLAYVSGHGPKIDGELVVKGKIGREVDLALG